MKADRNNKNYRTHVTALTLTKFADGLFDPKLVLTWLLTTIGASATWIGMLVPIREAGALLPQLLVAEPIRRMPIRKWVWIGGSVVQGAAAAGIALAALFLKPAVAGVTIVVLVGVLAVARSACSVGYKDVLGKTVEKTLRGQTSGTAAAFAAAGVFIFGSLLLLEVVDRYLLVVGALLLAGLFWVLAAIVFVRLYEEPSPSAYIAKTNLIREYWSYLIGDRELQRLILARGFLLATAITPPFLILLAGESATGVLGQLGALVIASALATMLSGRVWGKFSDYSTRAVLTLAGIISGSVLLIAVFSAVNGLFAHYFVLPVLLFIFMVAYQGVRIGRTTHLVNIANEDSRTAYTAISNTIIGVVLLVTAGLGFLANLIGVTFVVLLLASMCFIGAAISRTLTV